jgi:cytoskeletal protein CcmA (bactofilin family)
MFSSKPVAAKEIGSLIGAGTTVTGDISFTAGLRIDGLVKGAVRCMPGERGGMLVISEQGAVEGEVRATHLVVAGRISGPVYATELLELQPKARVNGDVHYRALEMHHGAVVEGKLAHQAAPDAKTVAAKPVVSAPSVSAVPPDTKVAEPKPG